VFVREKRPKLIPARRDVLQHAERLRPHRVELLQRVIPVRRDVLDSLPKILLRGRNPNHEELVEIGRGNREELDALEQRMRRVVGLVEYALIELEPAELAVDVEGGILEIGRIQVGRRHHAKHGLRRRARRQLPLGLTAPFCSGGLVGGIHKGWAV
jgi:hypothetical protein